MNPKIILSRDFRKPLIILLNIILYLILKLLGQEPLANIFAIAATLLGAYPLLLDTLREIKQKHFALDYIAIVAIVVALITDQYLVSAILALMISSGSTLESYAVSQAKKSLTNLVARIPSQITLVRPDETTSKVHIKNIRTGQTILIRKGEVVPLDGILLSSDGQTDESSLTGEPIFVDKFEGDQILSGIVNVGNPIKIKVTKEEQQSTYNKIVEMVKKAQNEKSPFIRLADRYSTIFTIITFTIAGISFYASNFSLERVLSVLAIATPCPLIIAAPIALLGGVNSAAKKRIIIKKLSSLESLAKIDTVIFDKTGTLTIGKPRLTQVKILAKNINEKYLLAVSEALERNSLHPLAKSIVAYAKSKTVPLLKATNIQEVIGVGIRGTINDKQYTMEKLKDGEGMMIQLKDQSRTLAIFKFEDELKTDSKNIIQSLRDLGLSLSIFTGDKREAAEKVAKSLGLDINIKSEATPQDKQKGISQLQRTGHTVAMVGDGINDAPALALANVGLVFANEEQTASSEAADVVFLGGSLGQVLESLTIAKRTISIANQSMLLGIGLSIIGMIFASFGIIPPLLGAGIQEFIDVFVILNAIRASI